MSEGQFGRYELIAPIGVGGMGEVFLARARGAARVQKAVVLKRLRAEQMNDEPARARFVDEARIAVSLSHPHIVPVFEFGELDGTYFLVMEWLRGGELSRIAGVDRAPLAWPAVASLGSQLCDALAYVHARKDRRGAQLVHGDVTPKNVLLSMDGHALLADFGLARFAPRGRAGTRRYLAPEQARGEPSDARADLYALALVLSEAATGKPALDRDPDRAEKQAKVGLVPELDDVDGQLAAFLRKALAPQRDARFDDAHQMRDAFEALLDREPRARATARKELIERIATFVRTDPASVRLEATVDRSAMATREATRLPARRAWAYAAVTAAIIVAAGAVGAARLLAHRDRPSPFAEEAKLATPPPTAPAPPTPTPLSSSVAASTPVPPIPPREHPAPRSNEPHRHAAPLAPPGHLTLNAVPWAHVRIDGVNRGETPIFGLELPEGTHQIELSNEPLGVRRTLAVVIKAGQSLERVEDLTQGP